MTPASLWCRVAHRGQILHWRMVSATAIRHDFADASGCFVRVRCLYRCEACLRAHWRTGTWWGGRGHGESWMVADAMAGLLMVCGGCRVPHLGKEDFWKSLNRAMARKHVVALENSTHQSLLHRLKNKCLPLWWQRKKAHVL